MAKYLDDNGLLYFWQKIKSTFARKTENVASITRSGTTFTAKNSDGDSLFTFTQQDNNTTYTPASAAPLMDGTAAVGTSAKYAREDHVHPSDTTRVPTTRAVNGFALTSDVTITAQELGSVIGNMTLEDDIAALSAEKVDKVSGKGLSTNDYTTTEKNKLANIAAGAEVNQNAFSNVKVGSTTVSADMTVDTLELVGGDHVSLTADATNDKITINASDTRNRAGALSLDDTKLFIIGATAEAVDIVTYIQEKTYIGADGHLYSNSKQTVNLSDTQALTNKTYNGYTLAAACAKGVATSIASGSTATTLPTCAAVEARITAAIASAQTGAAMFQGTVNASTDISGLTSYKKGWYWVVATAGTYAGQTCEAGDMIFCISDYSSAYKAADFSIVQNNIVTITNAEIDTIVAA